MYSATDGGRVRAWTRVSPDRVTVETNSINTEITGYRVDGYQVPMNGVGSIIRFDGPDEGLLHRAGKTIAAAVYLENAAVNYAKEPAPTPLANLLCRGHSPSGKERLDGTRFV